MRERTATPQKGQMKAPKRNMGIRGHTCRASHTEVLTNFDMGEAILGKRNSPVTHGRSLKKDPILENSCSQGKCSWEFCRNELPLKDKLLYRWSHIATALLISAQNTEKKMHTEKQSLNPCIKTGSVCSIPQRFFLNHGLLYLFGTLIQCGILFHLAGPCMKGLFANEMLLRIVYKCPNLIIFNLNLNMLLGQATI